MSSKLKKLQKKELNYSTTDPIITFNIQLNFNRCPYLSISWSLNNFHSVFFFLSIINLNYINLKMQYVIKFKLYFHNNLKFVLLPFSISCISCYDLQLNSTDGKYRMLAIFCLCWCWLKKKINKKDVSFCYIFFCLSRFFNIPVPISGFQAAHIHAYWLARSQGHTKSSCVIDIRSYFLDESKDFKIYLSFPFLITI